MILIEKLIFRSHLEDGEQVLYAVHKHWIVMLRSTLEVGFFGFLIPWGIFFMGFNTPLFFWVALIWSVIAYIRFLYTLLDWYSDVWLITDMGILIMEWNGFFDNASTRLGFEDIEGIGYEIRSFWGTVLRYGKVTLKVMSGNNMIMDSVANPRKAELSFVRIQDKILSSREMQDQNNLKTLLSQMVADHLKKQK